MSPSKQHRVMVGLKRAVFLSRGLANASVASCAFGGRLLPPAHLPSKYHLRQTEEAAVIKLTKSEHTCAQWCVWKLTLFGL